MSRIVRVAAIQMRCQPQPQENVDHAIAWIAKAAEAGANIVCLQELFHIPYPCQSEDHDRFGWAEPIPGPISQQLSRAAAQHSVVLIGSIFERRAPGLYHNSAVVFDADGSQVGFYRKMHIPDDPLFYEKFYFTPGDIGFPVAHTRYGKLGVAICWDQWYPEAARLLTLAGAEILFYPTAIGWSAADKETYGPSQHSAWETMMRSHGIANGLFVVAPNRVGFEGELEFWGASFISDPYGNVLVRGSHSTPELVMAECDLDLLDQARTHWPFLRDRRIDAYQDLTRRWIDHV
jgi:N-carbamoylputrescine amidase